MRVRQYKVKCDSNGKITPLEPIPFQDENQEGILIFVDSEKAIMGDPKAILSEQSLSKVWDNPEDDIYNDA